MTFFFKKEETMDSGKNICNELKAVRKRIAEENDIPLEIEECTYKGHCNGTCPRCEAEVRYLEQALSDRIRLGKAATIAGIALGLSATNNVNAQIVNPDNTTTNTTENNDVELLEGDVMASGIFPYVDTDPEFPGGEEALQRFIEENMQYPTMAAEQGIGGTVYVTCIIDTNGDITDAHIIRDIGGGCGEEALRIVKLMPRWSPAKNGGHAVRTLFNLPIFFDISKHRVPILQGIVPVKIKDSTNTENEPETNPDSCEIYKKEEKNQGTLRGDVRVIKSDNNREKSLSSDNAERPDDNDNFWIRFRDDNGTIHKEEER